MDRKLSIRVFPRKSIVTDRLSAGFQISGSLDKVIEAMFQLIESMPPGIVGCHHRHALALHGTGSHKWSQSLPSYLLPCALCHAPFLPFLFTLPFEIFPGMENSKVGSLHIVALILQNLRVCSLNRNFWQSQSIKNSLQQFDSSRNNILQAN